jgi:hypothetical protein
MGATRVRRVASAAAGLAAVLVAGSAAIAPAHKHTYPTGFASVGFQFSPASNPSRAGGTFSGQISSPNRGCLRARRVEFAYVDSSIGLVHNLQSTQTSANGSFQLRVPDGFIRSPESFRVKVHKKTVKNTRKHTHRCKQKFTQFPAGI